MTKREQIEKTIKDLEDLKTTFISSLPTFLMPHERIRIVEAAITLLEEYKKTPCAKS